VARALPRRDADGNILDWFGCATEIHDRKRKEEDLEFRVRQRTAELVEANERLGREIEERRRAQEDLARRTALADWRATQLQKLAAELTQTEERERRHLARVLHDHLQQFLVAAKLELLEIKSKFHESELAADTKRVISLLDEAIRESRSLTAELSPPVFYQLGLVAGLKWLGQQARDKFRLEVSIDADPSADLKDHPTAVFLFQTVRELILNAAKHSNASNVAIRLSPIEEGGILLSVADDGAGCNPGVMNPENGTGGFGLFSIRERLDLMGGKMEISSAPGRGMNVKIVAPCEKAGSIDHVS
jgi:signal transduction histidine kinase